MKWMFFVFSLMLTSSAIGMDVTDQDLKAISLQRHAVQYSQLDSQTAQEIQNYLDQQDALERILLTDQWLSKLSGITTPTLEQKAWVRSQVRSTQKLLVPDTDHSEKQITVVDLALRAKSTLHLWAVKQHAKDIHNAWLTGTFSWAEVLSNSKVVEQDGLVNWLNNLDETQLSAVVNSFNQFGLTHLGRSNEVLSVLINRTQSEYLAGVLFARPVDEFSYMTLQNLPHLMRTPTAISTLIQASQSKALESQAMLLLSREYSSNQQAQEFLTHALSDPKRQWVAAASLGWIKDQAFKQALLSQYKLANTALSRYANKELGKGDVQ